MRRDEWVQFVRAYDAELYNLAVKHGIFDECSSIDFAEWVRCAFVFKGSECVLYRKEIVSLYDRDFGNARPKIIIPMFRELTGAADVSTHQGRGFKGWAVRS